MVSENTKVILSRLFDDLQKDFNYTGSRVENIVESFRAFLWISLVICGVFGHFDLMMKFLLNLTVLASMPNLSHLMSMKISFLSYTFSVKHDVSFYEYRNILVTLRNFLNMNEDLISEEQLLNSSFIKRLNYGQQLSLLKMGADTEDLPLLVNIKNKEEEYSMDVGFNRNSLQWQSMKELVRSDMKDISSVFPPHLEFAYKHTREYVKKYGFEEKMIKDIEFSTKKLRW